MGQYRYLKDIRERGEDIFVVTPTQKINTSAEQVLDKRCVTLKVPRDLSSKSISNCRVPTDVLVYFIKGDECADKLLHRKIEEEFFNNVLDLYDKLFTYTIDGKEVTAREFYEYVRVDGKSKMANAYGEMVTKKKGDYYETWCVPNVVQEDVH